MGNLAPAAKFTSGGVGETGEQVSTVERETRTIINRVMDHINAAWVAWVPTLTYTGTGPASATTVARYRQTGKTVHFVVSTIKTDTAEASDATALTISPPVKPKFINANFALKAIQLVTTTYSDPAAYLVANTDTEAQMLIRFRNFTGMSTGAYSMEVSGSFETD